MYKQYIEFPDFEESYDGMFEAFNRGNYGFYGQLVFKYTDTTLTPDNLRQKYIGARVAVGYVDEDGNKHVIGYGSVTSAEVEPLQGAGYVVRLTFAGTQRKLKNISLELPKYAGPNFTDVEKWGRVLRDMSWVESCISSCPNPLIDFTAFSLSAFDSNILRYVWEPPNDDSVYATSFDITLSDGSVVNVKLSREAVVRRAECVPFGGCPPEGVCDVPVRDDVAKQWCCLMWKLDMFSRYGLSSDVSGVGAEAVGYEINYGSALDDGVGGTVAFSSANYVYCDSRGCYDPNVVDGDDKITCEFPDLQIIPNLSYCTLAGWPSWEVAKNTDGSEQCVGVDFLSIEFKSCTAKVTYPLSCISSNGSATTTQYTSFTQFGLTKIGCCGMSFVMPTPLLLIKIAFDVAKYISNGILGRFVGGGLINIVNALTTVTDVPLRTISLGLSTFGVAGSISNCAQSKSSVCHDFCEKWGRMIVYNIESVISSLGVLTSLPSAEMMPVMDDYGAMKLDAYSLVLLYALQNGKVLSFENGVSAYDTSTVVELSSCEGVSVAYGSAEYGASSLKLVSPLIDVDLVKAKIAELYESGAYAFECLPYKLAEILQNKVFIVFNGGGDEVITDKVADVARFPYTHAGARLAVFRVSQSSPSFGSVLGAKPGMKFRFYPNPDDLNIYYEFQIVDVIYRLDYIDIVVVTPDSVLKPNVQVGS